MLCRFLDVVVDRVIRVVDATFVYCGPCYNDDVVKFLRVAGVGVDVLVVRSGCGAFESGNRLGLCHLSGSSDGGVASPSIVKIPFGNVVFVSDFLLGVLAVFVEKVAHVLGKSRYPDRVVDVGGGDSLVKSLLVVVVVVEVFDQFGNGVGIELVGDVIEPVVFEDFLNGDAPMHGRVPLRFGFES